MSQLQGIDDPPYKEKQFFRPQILNNEDFIKKLMAAISLAGGDPDMVLTYTVSDLASFLEPNGIRLSFTIEKGN